MKFAETIATLTSQVSALEASQVTINAERDALAADSSATKAALADASAKLADALSKLSTISAEADVAKAELSAVKAERDTLVSSAKTAEQRAVEIAAQAGVKEGVIQASINSESKAISRSDFDKLTSEQKSEHVRSGGRVTE